MVKNHQNLDILCARASRWVERERRDPSVGEARVGVQYSHTVRTTVTREGTKKALPLTHETKRHYASVFNMLPPVLVRQPYLELSSDRIPNRTNHV